MNQIEKEGRESCMLNPCLQETPKYLGKVMIEDRSDVLMNGNHLRE